ncbi:MAG: neutral zinc metallopeptidase [Candidatus Dormibacteraeota bacterium]|nr:neutral zinc metallopeptidase [Candidatus Dormibacteraeota bacterium]
MSAPATPPPTPAPTLTQEQFATAVFNDVEAMWAREFANAGVTYHPARLVLFSQVVPTACGTQESDVGPFYCPADGTVYMDLAFLTAMQEFLRAPGDFARAYIIAHEVGHHVQNVLGISARAQAEQQRDPTSASAISVRVELQADCLAGVWAHSAYERNLIGQNEIEQALRAAASVGDDYQAKLAGHQVEPDNWSHGSSAQRQEWLERGFKSGDPGHCDTFAT